MLREIVFQDTNNGKTLAYLCHFPAGFLEPQHCLDWTCPRHKLQPKPLSLKESLFFLLLFLLVSLIPLLDRQESEVLILISIKISF
jgi:hypothetical protein